jgi:hypothetical protein
MWAKLPGRGELIFPRIAPNKSVDIYCDTFSAIYDLAISQVELDMPEVYFFCVICDIILIIFCLSYYGKLISILKSASEQPKMSDGCIENCFTAPAMLK